MNPSVLLCLLLYYFTVNSVVAFFRNKEFNLLLHSKVLRKASSDNVIVIPPIDEFNGKVILPGSKSLSNRVLLLASIANGSTCIENLLDCEDTRYMVDALQHLQVQVDIDWENKRAIIQGKNGPLYSAKNGETIHVFLGNAGTAMRPLTSVLAAGNGEFILDGTRRMRERPIKDLIDALVQLGVDITCSESGSPPVFLKASGIQGGAAEISGKISSQFVSSLLLAAPLAKTPITLRIKDSLISAPYVMMTVQLMRRFGVNVRVNDDMRTFQVSPVSYQSPGHIFIEGDASSASYFLAGAILCPSSPTTSDNRITIYGFGRDSIQGDIRFVEILRKMGASVSYNDHEHSVTIHRKSGVVLQGIDEDCSDIPDAAMTLAIVGIFARGKTVIRNVYSWRLKESERMLAIVTEMRKLGVTVEEGRDFLIIHGLNEGELRPRLKDQVEIETYDDHRMAMCFALTACAGVAVRILNPSCVTKTFPTFFQQFADVSGHTFQALGDNNE